MKKADLKAAKAITAAAAKNADAADTIVNCMTELKPTLQSLANRNHREILQTTSAVKQLVMLVFFGRKLSGFQLLVLQKSCFKFNQ